MSSEIKIDFVVTWLDANDPEWKKQYWKYRGDSEHKEDKGRYRNWDIFKYWFRAVESYAPWVNKVFLITNGKNPDWINPNHPKLVLVKHSDYMPEKYLPTFNSRAIELNFHRIKDLSEHFVYFNDDMFLNAPVSPEYYFKNGLPCDCNAEKPGLTPIYSPNNKFSIRIALHCNIAILNYNFSRKDVIKKAPWKWYGPHLWGRNFLLMNILLRNRCFEAFTLRHNEQPMLKTIIQEIWDKEKDMTEATCTKFRQDISLNPYIIRYWQFATNRFYPMKNNFGKYYGLGVANPEKIRKGILDKRNRSICLNDSPLCSDEDYKECKNMLHEVFMNKFPNKSGFEI